MKPPTRQSCLLLSGVLATICPGWQWAAPTDAQTPSNHNATRADFDRFMTELSNWGRWGKGDQMGAVNLITPAKRKEALSSVKEGFSVSMARKAETEPALDNPRPITRFMGGAGRGTNPASPPQEITARATRSPSHITAWCTPTWTRSATARTRG